MKVLIIYFVFLFLLGCFLPFGFAMQQHYLDKFQNYLEETKNDE